MSVKEPPKWHVSVRPVKTWFDLPQLSATRLALQPDAIFLRGGAYLERTSFTNQSSLTLVGIRIGADFNFTRHLGAGLGYEYRQRIGEGSLDYSVQQLYLQAIVYF